MRMRVGVRVPWCELTGGGGEGGGKWGGHHSI